MQNKRLIGMVLTVALLLLIPLIAMQFTDEVNWALFDFIAAGVLLVSLDEIANATMDYAKNILKIDKVIAIVSPNNLASSKLLNKMGLYFDRNIELVPGDPVQVFSESNQN